ncbi:MAG: bacillithiol biosynthesis cysteine-adding enzyme BshC, partial [Crocinitomicaceae bacterium]|nr:bacillithiol biosynthesis cysteine-adding enzyme BshC [Crocinitomicaceae bacterium]
MTGPLYFIYKILHVIKQCKELNEYYPKNHFVPVYWMASEDHDFEEIKSFLLFGKTITWESEQGGAVGRMNLFGMPQVFDSISQFFANHPESEIHNLISKLNGNTYGEAFFQFIHAIFGDLGLIILDGDNKAFKSSFKPVFQKELESSFSYNCVSETNAKLPTKNFKIQVQPREINLFYLSFNKRERIILNGENFEIGSQSFTKEETLQLLEKETASFSPNVVLRPLYQEYVLPNLCYVGGVGELSYWLQFKSSFEAAGVPFPMIQARTSIVWIDVQTNEKINSQALSTTDLFKSVNDLKQSYLQNNAEEEIDFSLLNFQFEQFKTDLTQKTENIDASINSWMGA